MSKFGLKRKEVRLERYNPGYKELFNKEKESLKKLLGDSIIDIEHIGSTAIPDILSKPCIDVQVGVTRMRNAKRLIKTFEKSGYEYKRNFGRTDQHILFVKGGDNRTHYIHLVKYKGDIWKDRIFFRDYLNSHKDVLKKYEKLKIQSAEKHPTSRTGYTGAKTEFVRHIMNKRKNTQSHLR